MAEPITLNEAFEAAIAQLHAIGNRLVELLAGEPTPRVRLFAQTFLRQHEELTDTVARAIDRTSARTADKRVLADFELTAPALDPDADSRTLSAWLITSYQALGAAFEGLADAARAKDVRNAAADLAGQILSHNRKVAKEANRFEDL